MFPALSLWFGRLTTLPVLSEVEGSFVEGSKGAFYVLDFTNHQSRVTNHGSILPFHEKCNKVSLVFENQNHERE